MWLRKAREQNVRDLAGIGTDSHFSALHADRRFQELVHEVGAPQQQ
jgi:hypothetical protein